MNSIMEDSSILLDRLEKVRISITKATDEAYKQSSFGTTSSATTTSPRSAVDNNNASFMLGMDLFGQDVSVLERNIQDKLEDVEEDLNKLMLQNTYNQQQQQGANDESMMSTTTTQEEEESTSTSPEELEKQAHKLKNHIQFLKQASLARQALDESISFSNVALSSPPTTTAAESTTTTNLIQSSNELMKAIQFLSKAKEFALLQHEKDDDAQHQHQQHQQIVTSINHAIRRHRVDLTHKASNVLDTSIQICGGPSNTESGSGGGSYISVKTSTQLESAYHVLETLDDNDSSSSTSNSNSALQETLRRFTLRLYNEIFVPILEPHKTYAEESVKSVAAEESTSEESNNNIPNNNISPWKVIETSTKPNLGLVGVSTATTTKSIITYRLEWQRNDDDDDSDGSTKKLHNTHIDVWKDTFSVIEKIMVFIQTKVLLERTKLCDFVGKRLFGKPISMPSTLKLEALGLESKRLGGDDRGMLIENILDLLTKTCLPDTPLKLKGNNDDDDDSVTTLINLIQTKQQLSEFIIPFCQTMATKQLLPNPDQRPKLVAFVQDFEKLYVDQRRILLLNKARSIIQDTDYHNTVRVGVDVVNNNTNKKKSSGGATTTTGTSTTTSSKMNDDIIDETIKVFQLHLCSISETSYKLMKLVRNTMDEAVDASNFDDSKVGVGTTTTEASLSLLRPTLYRTARDMLHLFRAMIPALQGSQIRNVPRTAAVLHNDCLFLSHHCLTLGLEYKEKFGNDNEEEEDTRGKLLKQTCLFVDMVPLFRELADTSLGDMLDKQKYQLGELVGTRITYLGKSLQSSESLVEWSEAETALAAGLYHLRHLSQGWKNVLSTEVYGRSLGYLSDVVFALYLQQILMEATKISPTACNFVSGLFQKAIVDIRELLLLVDDSSGAGAGSRSPRNNKNYNCNKLAMEWDRFVAIQKCFNMSSVEEIQIALSNGVFRSIQSHELARLIRSIFYENTPERNHLLNQLATVGE